MTPTSQTRTFLVLMVASMAGCGSKPDPAVEMREAVQATQHSIDSALLASELFWWATAPPTTDLRHGSTCGCPCRDRDQEADALVLDYHEDGCHPDSDLLPGHMRGWATLSRQDGRFVASVDGLAIGGRKGTHTNL